MEVPKDGKWQQVTVGKADYVRMLEGARAAMEDYDLVIEKIADAPKLGIGLSILALLMGLVLVNQ